MTLDQALSEIKERLSFNYQGFTPFNDSKSDVRRLLKALELAIKQRNHHLGCRGMERSTDEGIENKDNAAILKVLGAE